MFTKSQKELSEVKLANRFESATIEWSTPDSLFKPLQNEFNFNLDVAANQENTKCERFFDKNSDGLVQDWDGVCWMNPPFGKELKKWVAKVVEQQLKGVTTVCLIPARTNTQWFHELVIPNAEIRFVKGRPIFGGAKEGLPWPLLILVFKGK